MKTSTYDSFVAHAVLEAPNECCGLIVMDNGTERYLPCRNISRKGFTLHPEDWCKAEDAYRILAVCHSHPSESCKPTPEDIEFCEHTNRTFMIVGEDGLWRLDPKAYRENLVGREFCFGWADCYTLIRDYFGAAMHDYPRDSERSAGLLYNKHFSREGWAEVELEDLQVGDVLLVKSGAYYPSHGMVYLGEGKVLHHATGRLSSIETLDFLTLKRVGMVLRGPQ